MPVRARLSRLRGGARGGVVLDLVLAAGIVLIGAFLLYSLGLTFHQILYGAGRFFGL